MPTFESRTELDIQIRTHILANPKLYRAAGTYIDTTYSPEAFWQREVSFCKATRSEPLPLSMFQSVGNRIGRIIEDFLEIYRADRGIPPASEAARVVLLHWILTDRASNCAMVKLTEFQDWSIASVKHEIMRTIAFDIANNTEWYEYVTKAFAIMREVANHNAGGPNQAYSAAASFIGSLGTLAWHARQLTDPDRSKPSADDPDEWKSLGAIYAQAFIAWFDLSELLNRKVRDAARRAYPPGAPAIRLGKLQAMPTVIEAIGNGLGTFFRNVLYQSRQHPLDLDEEQVMHDAQARATARQVAQGRPATPLGWGADFDELMKDETRAAVRARLGIKNRGDGWMLFAREWENQDPALVRSKLKQLRCGSIDFDDLKTQLDREARAVCTSPKELNPSPITDRGATTALTFNDKNRTIVVEGKPIAVQSPAAYEAIKTIHSAKGGFVTSPRKARWDKLIAKLPSELAQLIESNSGPGGGYRLKV